MDVYSEVYTENLKDVNEKNSLALRQFFVARGQGKSLSSLHKARVEVNRIRAVVTLRPTVPLSTHAPYSEAVGPMKPLQGPTPVGGENRPDTLRRDLARLWAKKDGREGKEKLLRKILINFELML